MKWLYFVFLLGLASEAAAQTKGRLKLYGFRQLISGGKGPERKSEGVTTSEHTGKNYFLYAVAPSRI